MSSRRDLIRFGHTHVAYWPNSAPRHVRANARSQCHCGSAWQRHGRVNRTLSGRGLSSTRRGAAEENAVPKNFERGGAPTLAAAGWKKFSQQGMSAWLPRAEGGSSRKPPLRANCSHIRRTEAASEGAPGPPTATDLKLISAALRNRLLDWGSCRLSVEACSRLHGRKLDNVSPS